MAVALAPRGFPDTAGRRRRPTGHSPGARLVAVIALAGVCLLPVEYRGGAEHPHAHATVQLWLDLATGSFDHHPHPSHHGHEPGGATVDAPSPPVAVSDSPDTPRWTTFTPTIERTAIVVAVAVLGIGSLIVRAIPLPGQVLFPPGRTVAPEPPPPRSVAISR